MLYFSYEFGLEQRAYKGGGGGGSSGKVEYPAYLQNVHSEWLDDSGADALSTSMVDVMNSAIGSSPFTGIVVYDPDPDITSWLAELGTLNSLVDLLSSGTGLDTLISNILSTSRIDDEIDAFSDSVDAQITSEILPKFEAGMRDINAVISSAFVIGRALISETKLREVARYAGALRMKSFGDDALKVVALKLGSQQSLLDSTLKAYGMKISSKKDQIDDQLEFDEKDARWDLEVFQYGANLIAAPSGGVAVTGSQKGPSKTQAALGGAMAGAAVGASFGGWGAVVGAVVGGVAGYMSA